MFKQITMVLALAATMTFGAHAQTKVKVGLTGFCKGGAVTIIGASRIPEISAGVCF